MNEIGIYVHFPFCASKCKYCNFNSYDDKEQLKYDYLQALINEIKLYKNKKLSITTIFIGGGTPSAMFDGCITTLMGVLRDCFNILDNAEITIEANPNSITLAKVREWKDSGINRVSLGLQTDNDKLLKLIGRVHSRQDYINAVDIIRGVGITNINTDLLVGLPKQRLSNVKHSLKLINKLNCSHVSVYSLILEENTPLFEMVNKNELKLPKEQKTIDMYNFAYEYLKENGYNRYEVSNFAKKNCECKHNLNTWQMCEYLGFGAGAHSFFKNIRYNNVPKIEEYISLVESNKKPLENSEKLSKQEMFEETIMLGLRTKYGIDLDDIKEKYGIDMLKEKRETINQLLTQGFINLVYNKIIATDSGLAVLNKLILDLIT